MRHWRHAAVVTSAVLALSAVTVWGQELRLTEKQLRDQYQGKVFRLRQCYAGFALKFDLEGRLIGKPQLGGCAGNQSFLVKRVDLHAEELELGGERIIVFYDSGGSEKQILSSDDLTVKLVLGPALADPGAIERGLGKIFHSAGDSKVPPPPTPEQYQSAIFDIRPGPPLEVRRKGTHGWKTTNETDEPVDVGKLENDETLYIASDSITSPQPTHTGGMAADYLEAIRAKGEVALQVVVDSQGFVHSIRLKKPAGTEIDGAVLRAVSQWTFKPATLRRRAVPVIVDVNMNVHFR